MSEKLELHTLKNTSTCVLRFLCFRFHFVSGTEAAPHNVFTKTKNRSVSHLWNMEPLINLDHLGSIYTKLILDRLLSIENCLNFTI